MNPDKFETEGIDLLMPTKLRLMSFALTLKSSLLDLNHARDAQALLAQC